MHQLSTFQFGSNPVRVVTGENGEPFWVAKDVAEALGYKWKGASSIKHVPQEWRGVYSVQTPSGEQEMVTISEAGLYFFLGRSDKPAALPMQKWVAGEVLPSIRKTGSYTMPTVAAPKVSPKLTGAVLGRMKDQLGHKGTTEAMIRMWPEWFANLPGERPQGPQEVVTPTLGLTQPVKFELHQVS